MGDVLQLIDDGLQDRRNFLHFCLRFPPMNASQKGLNGDAPCSNPTLPSFHSPAKTRSVNMMILDTRCFQGKKKATNFFSMQCVPPRRPWLARLETSSSAPSEQKDSKVSQDNDTYNVAKDNAEYGL